jgi:hypothetical protein
VRTLEEKVIENAPGELAHIEQALDQADRAALRRMWRAPGISQRVGAAAKLVRAAYRVRGSA